MRRVVVSARVVDSLQINLDCLKAPHVGAFLCLDVACHCGALSLTERGVSRLPFRQAQGPELVEGRRPAVVLRGIPDSGASPRRTVIKACHVLE